jgi:iron complex transport system permease protein
VNSPSRSQVTGLLALIVLAMAVAALRLFIDRDPFTGEVSLAWPHASYAHLRWTALGVGMTVGAGLAVCGVILQALLRNPLAEPFILGLSSGAGLGVMAAMYAAHAFGAAASWLGDSHAVPAIAGSLVALAVVYGLGQRRGVLDPVSLVLVGVIVSTICGAGIMFFQHLVPTGLRGQFTLWLMGNINEGISRATLAIAGGFTAAGVIVGVLMGRAMDAATLGDDEARSVGLSIGWLRVGLFALASAIAAITVAIAGPIAFVGLIAPHAARLVLGPRHGLLSVGAALVGILLVVGSDVARQALDFGGGRMPVGVFTAIIGGPAFIWLLLSGRGQA